MKRVAVALRLALVSSTSRSPSQPFEGTKLFLDDWCKQMKNVAGQDGLACCASKFKA